MWSKLDGWKTIITAGAAFATAVCGVMGVMTEATAYELQTMLIPLALVFLRMGVGKVEPPKE